eukprot:scaffold996_cov409-Prasinococcus_capsulatus_cf.AAC.30
MTICSSGWPYDRHALSPVRVSGARCERRGVFRVSIAYSCNLQPILLDKLKNDRMDLLWIQHSTNVNYPCCHIRYVISIPALKHIPVHTQLYPSSWLGGEQRLRCYDRA